MDFRSNHLGFLDYSEIYNIYSKYYVNIMPDLTGELCVTIVYKTTYSGRYWYKDNGETLESEYFFGAYSIVG